MMGTAVPPTDMEKAQPEMPTPPVGCAQVAHPMRGMFKKEMMELVPGFCVMTGIFVVLYVLMVFTYMPGDPEHRKGDYLQPMFSTTMPVFVPVLAMCLCGILTGGIQFFRESKIDQYAFLTHRPLIRTRIYVCRILSAHLVLLLVTVLPTLLFYAWATAQEVASEKLLHDWLRFTMTGIFAASGSYFAGVLLVTRVTAKWYGTLMLPIFTAFSIGLAAGSRDTKWAFLAIAIPGLMLMALAGHGSFTTFGQLRSQKWYERFALGTLLLPGIMYFILMLCLIVGESAWKNKGSLEPEPVVPIVEKDGTPVLLYTGTFYYRAIHTLDDRLVRVNPNMDELPHSHLMRTAGTGSHRPELYLFASNRNLYPIPCKINGRDLYISIDERYDNRFTLYEDSQERNQLGILDSERIKPRYGETIVPFADHVLPLKNNHLLIGNAIYLLMQDCRVQKMYELPDGLPFTHVGIFGADHGLKFMNGDDDLMIATEKHLYQINYTALIAQNRYVIKKEWPREPGNWDMSLFWPTMDNTVIRYDAKDNSHTLLVYTDSGKRVKVTAPHLNIPPMTYWPWGKILLKSLFGYSIHIGCATECLSRSFDLNKARQVLHDVLWERNEGKAVQCGVVIIGLLTASAMWWVLARQHFDREKKILWTFLAFVFGPAVLLLRLAIVPSRVMEKCPDCHKKRPVELMECPHCHKPWSAPTRDGREIFA